MTVFRNLTLAALAAIVPLALGAATARAASGDISTVAGGGAMTGDGVAATSAQLFDPVAVVPTAGGGFLISEEGAGVVRRVGPGGTITTVAGTGSNGVFDEEETSATGAQLNHPQGLAVLPDGSFLIADSADHRVLRVSGTAIAGVAGTGVAGYTADDIAATDAMLGTPFGVAPATGGGFLISESTGSRIRKVFDVGIIETVAGTGTSGLGADGSAPLSNLDDPVDVAAVPDHSVLIAESAGNRVRRVSGGTITTVAGTGSAGFLDGLPATSAKLQDPSGVAAAPDGGFLIADSGNQRIRRVGPGGTISTVAGTGTAGYDSDGVPATSAKLNDPARVAIDPQGGFFIADTGNQRVRHVEGPPPPSLGAVRPDSPANHNSPRVSGSSPAAGTVYLFSGAGCPGLPVGSGPSATFAAAGIAVPVLDNTVTRFSAIVEQGGIDSGCSATTARYVEDSRAPDTRITAGPRGRSADRTPAFGFRAIGAGPGARFRCGLDHRPLHPCAARTTFGPLSPGRHSVRVAAIDAAGNADRSPATRAFQLR